MKFVIGLVASVLVLNCIVALPAGTLDKDAEVIEPVRRRLIPVRLVPASIDSDASGDDASDDTDFTDFKGTIDTGAGFPFLQSRPVFGLGFFDSFEDIFRRLHSRLVPFGGFDGIGGDGNGDETSIGLPLGLDTDKGKTTSTVKVIDGHKVEVNETVYGDENNVLKVRMVHVRPLDSGEVVEESVATSNNAKEETGPSTSGPLAADQDSDEEDDRREPLEKSPEQNEIRNNVDPEHSTTTITTQAPATSTMLPTLTDEATNTVDDNANASLNAAFVTDNSLEVEAFVQEIERSTEDTGNGNGNGNIETETNKPDNDSSSEEMTMTMGGGGGLESERYTIENNEEAEVNDNLNESATETSATELAAETETADADAAAGEATTEELTADLSALQLDEANERDGGVENDDDSDSDGEDPEDHEQVRRRGNNREDLSSDDESVADPTEMSAEFNSEWADLADELSHTNDRDNDLSNEIDGYDAIPIDLSNDIAVNDIAAAQPGYPLNPDAEFVDVDGMVMMGSSMPKFEKLTVTPDSHPSVYQTPHDMK